MANQIILKRSSTAGKTPTTAQLALGEIAINTHDGRIFIKKDNGVPAVIEIGGVTSVNTQTGDVVLSTSDVAEGSNQYFTTARARSALSAGTGISFSSTGVISTSQNISTTGTPTFAGATVNGDLTVRNVIPSSSNTYDLGSETNPFRHIFVGPGSLYVNGKQVLTEESGTMTFTADLDQNMRVTTTGTGLLQFGSSTTGVNIDGTLQIAAGKRITSSDGVKVQFGDDVELNGNKVIGLGIPTAGTDAATKGYVDTAIGAISTSTITQGNSSVQVVDSGTGTVTVTVDGSTALTVTSAGVVVAGGLTVNGTTTTVNSNTIALADNIITLNSDATGAPTQNAGIEVERGDEANVQMRWNEGLAKWTFTNDGAVYNTVAASTTDLVEGTNQYFTTGRARTAISASTSSGVSYNSTSGLISLGSIPNSSLTNNSITLNGAAIALGGSRTLATDDIAEGSTNQYFTTARARSSVSAGTGISYNSTTGAIASTITQYTDALAVSANASAVSGAISTAATDATTKANAAQTAAISAAATDATTKANAAKPVAGTGISVSGTTVTSTITQYTDANARASISGGSGITYNSTTGVIYNNITNNNQLSNGAGFITGYTETSTLANVTARGATTTAALSTGALTVTGGITATGEITAYFSDANLKKDIVEIQDPIAKLMSIRGVTFRPNQTALDLGITDKEEVGVIAQEIEAVLPQLVCPSAFDGFKTVKYDKLTALLIEAVKAQQTQIEALTAQVAKLSGQ